ncbi:MAG: minor capsid protein [Endomicrobium sp.]|jgi:hypothetical protein|nr:minor capsid protein [Endomicrobium sp.]
MNVKVNINISKVMQKVGANKRQSQRALDAAVLKDSAPFVPFQTGNLEKSGILSTTIGSGLVVYNAPYARAQYYGLFNHSKNKHSRATRLWFEFAKAQYLTRWIQIVQEILYGKKEQ